MIIITNKMDEKFKCFTNFVAVLLICSMIVTILPLNIYADTENDYTIDNNGFLTHYSGSGGHLTIPASVKVIASNVFQDNWKISSVSIPSSVTSIREGAFQGCENLTTITIAENSELVTIGELAFYACSNLTEITMPASVISIGSQAFNNCLQLTSVTFEPNSKLAKLDNKTFAETRIQEIIIPASVKNIGDGVFEGCIRLSAVTILNPTASIHEAAFSGAGANEDIEFITMYGYEGSTAQNFAANYENIVFIAITEEKTDKSELQNAISTANHLITEIENTIGLIGDDEGQYPQFAIDILKGVVVEIQTILDDDNATQPEIDAATAELIMAITTLVNSKIPITSISSVIVNGIFAAAVDENIFTVELPFDTVLGELTVDNIIITTTDNNATVSDLHTSDGGFTWTFNVIAENGITIVTYTINITITANPNIEIVANAINDLPSSYIVAQNTANTENDIQAWIERQIADIIGEYEVDVNVTIINFTEAIAGTLGNESGIDGSFNVIIKFLKESIEQTSEPIIGTIIATGYEGPTQDEIDISFAKSEIENHNWTVSTGIFVTEEWIQNELNEFIHNDVSAIINDFNKIEAVNGTSDNHAGISGSYYANVTLTKGDISDIVTINGIIPPIPYTASIDTSVSSVIVNGIFATAVDEYIFTVELRFDTNLDELTVDNIIITTTNNNATVNDLHTSNGGFTWTFNVIAEDTVTVAAYTINVTITANPNIEIVANAINDLPSSYIVEQTIANTQNDVQAWIEGRIVDIIAEYEVDVNVTIINFTEAIAGIIGNELGTDGGFIVVIKFMKESIEQTSEPIICTITATIYNGLTQDEIDISLAKSEIINHNWTLNSGIFVTEEWIQNELNKFINNDFSVIINDFTKIEAVNGTSDNNIGISGSYSANITLTKGDISDTIAINGIILPIPYIKSGDAGIISITVNGYGATCNGLNYFVTLPIGSIVSAKSFNVITNDSKARIGIAEIIDNNNWSIIVTAENGNKITYIITVTETNKIPLLYLTKNCLIIKLIKLITIPLKLKKFL